MSPPPDQHPFERAVEASVLNRLSDPDFGKEHLCDVMQVELSMLNRQLMAITGYTADDYILTIRLRIARELLSRTNWSVAEVASEVGYASASQMVQAIRDRFIPQVWRHQG